MLLNAFVAFLAGAVGFLLGLSLQLLNERFDFTKSVSPTTLDFFLFISPVILGLFGAIYGLGLAKRIQPEQTSTYTICLFIALLILTATCTYLYLNINNQKALPLPQETSIASQLPNSTWSRTVDGEELATLTKTRPKQIRLLFFTRDESLSCERNQSYTAEFFDGETISSCWRVTEDGKSLVLQKPDGSADYYNNLTIDVYLMSFTSAGQIWKFTKNRGD